MSVKHPAAPSDGDEGASLDPAMLQKLMAYADGELDGGDLAEIQTLLETSPNAVRVLEQLSVLGDCLRIVAETHPVRVPEGIADAVIARIHEDAKPKQAPRSEGGLRVIDFAARRRRTYGLVAGLVAAAAAVVLVARVTNEEMPSAERTASTATPNDPARAASASPLALATAQPATDVPSPVSVILIPSEGETASSIVIWLGEESTSGGPVK